MLLDINKELQVFAKEYLNRIDPFLPQRGVRRYPTSVPTGVTKASKEIIITNKELTIRHNPVIDGKYYGEYAYYFYEWNEEKNINLDILLDNYLDYALKRFAK